MLFGNYMLGTIVGAEGSVSYPVENRSIMVSDKYNLADTLKDHTFKGIQKVELAVIDTTTGKVLKDGKTLVMQSIPYERISSTPFRTVGGGEAGSPCVHDDITITIAHVTCIKTQDEEAGVTTKEFVWAPTDGVVYAARRERAVAIVGTHWVWNAVTKISEEVEYTLPATEIGVGKAAVTDATPEEARALLTNE